MLLHWLAYSANLTTKHQTKAFSLKSIWLLPWFLLTLGPQLSCWNIFYLVTFLYILCIGNFVPLLTTINCPNCAINNTIMWRNHFVSSFNRTYQTVHDNFTILNNYANHVDINNYLKHKTNSSKKYYMKLNAFHCQWYYTKYTLIVLKRLQQDFYFHLQFIQKYMSTLMSTSLRLRCMRRMQFPTGTLREIASAPQARCQLTICYM